MKQKLFVITGPTAVGKSEIAVSLALKNNTSIISADSMQIYRGLDIGTGKITSSEMNGVPHYMIDVANPDEEYSVGKYVEEAEKILTSTNDIPLIVGGTGLYISALINGSNFACAEKNDEIREKWKEIAAQKGKEFVYDYLKSIDAESAKKINVADVKRVIRAIEIYEITGKPKSLMVSENKSKYDATIVVLTSDRDKLYEKINARVDKMFDNGLVEEVRSLMEYKDCQSMQAIGYKETVDYLLGKTDLTETKEIIKQNSRRYAKRQMTYFKGMKVNNIIQLKTDDFAQIFDIFDKFKYYV